MTIICYCDYEDLSYDGDDDDESYDDDDDRNILPVINVLMSSTAFRYST